MPKHEICGAAFHMPGILAVPSGLSSPIPRPASYCRCSVHLRNVTHLAPRGHHAY